METTLIELLQGAPIAAVLFLMGRVYVHRLEKDIDGLRDELAECREAREGIIADHMELLRQKGN